MKTCSIVISGWVPVGIVVKAVVFMLFARAEKPSFEGTYLRYSEHEFGKEWDSLIIKKSIAQVYRITHKWKYERLLDGNQLSPEYKILHTSAFLQPKQRLLIEELVGCDRLVGEVLQVGETRYQKLK
jgi:hypothetical protein